MGGSFEEGLPLSDGGVVTAFRHAEEGGKERGVGGRDVTAGGGRVAEVEVEEGDAGLQ